jgi:Zn finger protein HypA/HybF involved in hydrogenase expression
MSAQASATLRVQCGNRSCRKQSEALPMKSQIVICPQCGDGKRVRVKEGDYMYILTLAPLEPPHDDPKQLPLNSGALMAGWR